MDTRKKNGSPIDGAARQRPLSRARVALLVADGVDADMVRSIYASLLRDGAVPRIVGLRLGKVRSLDDCPLDVEIALEAGPSVLYDGVVVPDGGSLGMDPIACHFLRQQYRFGKPVLAIASGIELLVSAGIPMTPQDGSLDPGLILSDGGDALAALAQFKAVLALYV